MFFGEYEKRISKLETQVHGIKNSVCPLTGKTTYYVVGVVQENRQLQLEVAKLKAIVAELCNFVYADKRK